MIIDNTERNFHVGFDGIRILQEINSAVLVKNYILSENTFPVLLQLSNSYFYSYNVMYVVINNFNTAKVLITYVFTLMLV